VDGCDVLAYSCAAARELHPLPCLRLRGKDAQTEGHFKEQNYVEREIYRAGWWEVKLGYYLVVVHFGLRAKPVEQEILHFA
jgi:hypothetical protein